MSKSKHRRGLLSAFKKNGSKSKQSISSAMSTARAFRSTSNSTTATSSSSSSRPVLPVAPLPPTRAQLLVQPQHQLNHSSATTTPATSPKRALHRYHSQAQEYEDRLSKSWDPLPGIRLFLDGQVVVNELRQTAKDGRENGALRMWPTSTKFYKVTEHVRLFPVLCEYLKTWSRRRSKDSTLQQTELAIPPLKDNVGKSNTNMVMPSPPSSEKTVKQLRKSPVQESRHHIQVVSETSEESEAKQKKHKKHKKNNKKKQLKTEGNTGSSTTEEVPTTAPTIAPPKQHEFDVQPPSTSVAIPEGTQASLYLNVNVVAYLSKSKTWYEGKLWYINLDGSFDVLFNDGDRRTCLPAPLVRWTGSTTDGSKQPKQQTEQSATKIDYKLGDTIRARHRSGWKYFAGKIIQINTNETNYSYDVKYDDDEIERHMSTNHIAPLPKHTTSGEIGQQLGLPIGKFVECKYNGKKQWYRGNIKDTSKTGNTDATALHPGMYTIQYEDGEIEQLKRKHLWVVRKMTAEGKKEIGNLFSGQKVQARYGQRLQWFDGHIIKRQTSEEGKAVKDAYDIVYSDGDTESNVARWLIREVETKGNEIVIEGELIWTSSSIECDGNHLNYVYKMHEHEMDEKGSTEIYLYLESDPFKVVPLAWLSISDDDVPGILQAGGVTEEQMVEFTSTAALCEAVSDMIVIKGGDEGNPLKLEIES